MKVVVAMAVLVTAVGASMGQTPPDRPAIPPAPAAPVAGPVAPVTAAPEVKTLLVMLHDRKDTLKDFTAKMDYNVTDPRGGSTGKTGTVAYLMDAAKGPIFSADFIKTTVNGKPNKLYHEQLIFDGKDLTDKDYGLDDKGRNYWRKTLLPPGAKPGDAVTLNGALPLPIGLDVNDVLHTFDVTLQPSKDPNLAVLRLVPHDPKKFEYKQMDVSVDRKQELPVKLEQTAKGDEETADVTTIELTGIEINTGKAKMLDASTPASDGWTLKAE
jgi:hypothetical protein